MQLFLREETVRVITAGNAILQKSHVYEALVDLQRAATAAASEPQQVKCLSTILYLYFQTLLFIVVLRRK